MMDFDAHTLVWTLGAVQLFSLFSAWIARLAEGSHRQASCQWLYLGCLALMGLTTMVSVAISFESWIFCSFTLSLMVVAVLWDYGRQPQPARI